LSFEKVDRKERGRLLSLPTIRKLKAPSFKIFGRKEGGGGANSYHQK